MHTLILALALSAPRHVVLPPPADPPPANAAFGQAGGFARKLHPPTKPQPKTPAPKKK